MQYRAGKRRGRDGPLFLFSKFEQTPLATPSVARGVGHSPQPARSRALSHPWSMTSRTKSGPRHAHSEHEQLAPPPLHLLQHGQCRFGRRPPSVSALTYVHRRIGPAALASRDPPAQLATTFHHTPPSSTAPRDIDPIAPQITTKHCSSRPRPLRAK